MTDPDLEHFCELHDWQTIGTTSTANGLLALVAPYYAHTLGKWWDRRLVTMPRHLDPLVNFQEITLEQTTISVTNPDGYADSERALLIACDNGLYDIDARFCDQYDDGHLSICELRIRLHRHEHDDDDDDDDEPTART